MERLMIVAMGLLWLLVGVAQVEGDDIPIDGTWVISNSSVSTANGQLVVTSNGIVDDGWAEHSLSMNLSNQNPVVIDSRQRLDSGGENYRLPIEDIFFASGSTLSTTYLPSGPIPYGWHFTTASGDSSWSGIDNPPVPGENYWAVTRLVLTPTGGELFLKPDDAAQGWYSDQFEPVLSTSWASESSITGIRFKQPWDAAFTVDYVNVTVTPEPSTLALLSVGIISLAAYAWRRKRRAA